MACEGHLGKILTSMLQGGKIRNGKRCKYSVDQNQIFYQFHMRKYS